MRSIILIDDDQNVIDALINHISWEPLSIKVQDVARNGEEALKK
ncbi:putative response regulator [Bacillus sp. TS-2]|nr:putative response regulator [Bacillus sp. TS-2]